MTTPLLRTARASFALLAIAAWLFAANHCVVAGLTPKAPASSAQHEQCPGHKAPTEEQKNGECDGSSCCKSLSAPLALAKNLVGYDLAIFVKAANSPERTVGAPRARAEVILELDTGPPGSISFAESVLQRSLLAHAPPVLA